MTNHHHLVRVVCAFLIPLVLSTPSAVLGQTIDPPQVFAVVAQLRNELEMIRIAMDAPRETRPEIAVRNAQPREVYFQAVTLVLKGSRLCNQSFMTDLGPPAEGDIEAPTDVVPRHVWNQVQRALRQVRCAKTNLELTESTGSVPVDPTKTPTDVFKSIVQANRQMNLLLRTQVAPGDVFALVYLSNQSTASILDELIPVWRMRAPELPAYEEDKIPADVYQRLVTCYDIIEQIAQVSDLEVLRLDAELEVDPAIVPGDVFDMAALVHSEIRYFTEQLDMNLKFALFVPEKKDPSDVYQLAGQLEAQLRLLWRLVAQFPTWHRLER